MQATWYRFPNTASGRTGTIEHDEIKATLRKLWRESLHNLPTKVPRDTNTFFGDSAFAHLEVDDIEWLQCRPDRPALSLDRRLGDLEQEKKWLT